MLNGINPPDASRAMLERVSPKVLAMAIQEGYETCDVMVVQNTNNDFRITVTLYSEHFISRPQ